MEEKDARSLGSDRNAPMFTSTSREMWLVDMLEASNRVIEAQRSLLDQQARAISRARASILWLIAATVLDLLVLVVWSVAGGPKW